MRPDRPIRPIARFVRRVVRAIRILQLRMQLRGRLQLGSNVTIGASAVLLPPRQLRIGDNVSIGREFHVETNVAIGSDVLISSRVAIVGRDHRMDDPQQSIYWAGRLPPAQAIVEGDNLIGFGTIIVAPATIGRGCVVGAGSVVVGDLPANTICAGVPAKVIRPRFPSGVSRDPTSPPIR